MKKITQILMIMTVLSLCFVGTVTAWELQEDFVLETPYNIEANCGGGCQVQLGLLYLVDIISLGDDSKKS